jgi:hypothetical protein
VPKVAITEDSNALALENDVRVTWQRPDILPKAVASPPQFAA